MKSSTAAAVQPRWDRLRLHTGHWISAARPRTLFLAVSPVIAGLALAWFHTGTLAVWTALGTLFGATAIQIGTNLYNDAADFERGTDTPDRLGPARASAQGWFSSTQVKHAAHLVFLTAFLVGLLLVIRGGWPIFLLGLAAILAGYAYTSGPKPIAYGPYGELFVLAFFGIAAVAGTYYLQSLQLSAAALLLGSACGLPSAAVLVLNNYRDFDTDQRAGRRTLNHLLGKARARQLYAALLLGCVPLFLLSAPLAHSWPVLLGLPMAIVLIRRLFAGTEGRPLNALLGQTALYQSLLVVLLAGGLAWPASS
ncbi:1,4-dihydroxy-2-naphthoate octaprenyltransferase [Rhabdochromatium marinum]|uniref:1,4-dihydroxy-2-naphthoate octaprenyltransferase n=1 Tax=Rhabdochromatium marinum TaxID=48729 RepID=UPI001902FE0A|nr:1,4-dihydroxy-2-naphthoate octaprenyltransferase [Rhabdochromatium marinum]MBK1647707.1 1,4-dihydroxy-2-naphthoate octaprenyltransferase [Rhabdochromatium marinum]